jgi:hypothetical protein
MAYWRRHDSVDAFLESQREFEAWQRRLTEATQDVRAWVEKFLAGAALSERPSHAERRAWLLAKCAPSSVRHPAAPSESNEEN